MFQILYFFKIVQSACPYTSFDQFQLNSTNFYQEQSYLRGSQYAFGVWTQYAPIRKNQYSNKSKSYFDSTKTLNGFHILNFQNDGNIQTLFYQQPVYQTGYPNLIILQNTQSGVLSYKIQEGLYYHEGYWIFTYFSFNYDNKYNFASYSTGDDRFFNFLITNRRLQTQTINAKLEHGGQGLYKIGTSYYNLQIFLGRISIITLFQNSIIFFNNNDKAKFITFISTCSIPQACQNEVELLFFKEPCNKFNCTHRQYHTDIPGLRYMFDFWLKRDSQKVRSENELIFQYGGLFPNLDPFYQLALYWRVINQDVILLHHLDIYYLVPGELQTQYNDNFLIQLFKPRSSYVQWNYLKYEFQKIGVYQYVYVSIYQSCCDIWEQYYVLNFAYYQQYSNYQATLTFFTESINATIVPFEGMISNLRFRYCYTLDFQFGKEFNINCNALCKTCTGPTQYDCSSCYEDQNRQLQSEIKQCLCKIDYQESDNLKCEKTFLSSIYEMKELYKEFQISQIQQQFKCKYGYFEVWKDLQFMGCIVCPYYNQVDDQINCINCIMDSHKWYLNPICNIDYKSDGYHSYFNEQLDYYSQELFIIHIDLMVTELCYGCEQIINAKNKRSINRYINGQNILYQCKSFMYVNNNSCKYCYNNCVNCQDNGLCVQCDNKFYIRNEMCQSCPEECSQCLLDVQLDQIKCISCQNGHALVNNKCLKCGYLCDDCEQRVNKNSGQEYLKCLKCSYNSYISLDGESCYYNTLEHCIYPFQFSIIDNSISTILYDFQPQESQFIKTGCTYCSPISYLTPINNIFTCTPQGIDQIISGCYQTLHYSDQMDCSIGINNQMDIGFGYCSQFIPHCITCLRLNWEYVNICYLCEDGYYNDYYTSFCKPCNPECKTCIQTDSSKIVKPSIIKVFSMIANFKGSLQYQLWTQNPNNQSISIICMECVDGYVKYFDKCIQQCPTNCKECKIINEQYICVACIQFESSNYQVYNGRCIQCPQNCQSCYPRTNEEKLQINPYFSNINFDYFSHKCISSFSNNLIYDQDIQQFIKCDSFGQGCQNQIQIEIYLYCNQIDLDNYLNSLDQQQQIIQRKFHLLLQNFDLSLYEYYEYYLYLNQNYIKKLTYQIKLVDNQICSLNQDLYIESTLQTNCFNLIELNLNIYGAYNPFILNNVLRISNFTHIKLQNINFHIQKGRINLSNIKDYSVIFETVNFYQNSDLKVIDQLVQIQESSEFIIQNMSIYNLNFNSQNGLFLFINQFASQKLMFNNLTIINSRFYNTYTFNFNQTQSITLEILHLNIQDSEFQNSTLIQKSILNQNFKIENLIIQNSVIVNTICFLNLQELNLVELRGIYISNSIFQDSNFLQSSNILNLKEFNFQNLNLKGQSTLITNQIHSNFEIITLQNGYFKNNIYQNKQAFILLLNSQTIYLQSIEFINNSIDYVNLKNTFIKNIELSIMNIESEIVVFDNLIVQRGIGFPEFTIKNTNIFTLLNSSVTLFEKYSFKSLFNNDDCQITTFNKFLYNNLINLQDVSEINIKNTNITNLILYDSVLIEIQKLSQENSQFTIYNCNLSSNILHQINNYQKISLISISSNFYLDLNLTQVTFSQNLQNLQKESNPKKQSLILILEASQSQTLIKNCLIDRNMNLNGFGSILYIDADKIIVENTSFLSNSVFIYDTVRQFLRWGFSEKMYLESLQKLYVTSSNGGNGNFQGREIIFKNLQLKNSSSKQGAAFVINMKENGIIEIQNSTFNNLESDLIESSQGGAFHISSQQSYLSIKVQSSIFFNISTRKSGSIFYIVPSKVLFNISILHSNIQDVYSIQGGFIYVEKSIHQIQVISMKNCSVSQNQQNFINYINSLSDLSNNELNILTQDYSFIYCYDCQFRIKDFSISKYPFIPLFQFYGSIYLKNIFITNIVFSSKLLLFSTVQQSDQIIMNGLELRNCTQQNILENKIPSLEQEKKLNMNQIVISCSNNLIDSPQSLLSYHESYSNQNEITLLHMLINQIQQFQSSVTQFLGFEYQNKITLFQIKVLNNTCNYCLNGIMNFMNSQKSLIAIQDIIVQNSSCGSNGCISFISSFNQRLLQFQEFQTSTDKQNTLINISQLYCIIQGFFTLFVQNFQNIQLYNLVTSFIQSNVVLQLIKMPPILKQTYETQIMQNYNLNLQQKQGLLLVSKLFQLKLLSMFVSLNNISFLLVISQFNNLILLFYNVHKPKSGTYLGLNQ